CVFFSLQKYEENIYEIEQKDLCFSIYRELQTHLDETWINITVFCMS
ncbi:hypothetical protein AVEN_65052-1, partial [Araneus ventricosus]